MARRLKVAVSIVIAASIIIWLAGMLRYYMRQAKLAQA